MNASNKRIAGAFLLGTLLVIGAFVMSKKQTPTQEGSVATVVGRTYVKTPDTDTNGIPDWQDSLLENSEIVLATTSTSTYEAPTTVTGKFGLRFFENFVRSKLNGTFGDSNEELTEKSLSFLKKEAADVLFTEKDIILFESNDTNALRVYGNQLAVILSSSSQEKESEISIFEEYMRSNDPEKLAELNPISASYVHIVQELLKTQTPSTYFKEHLDLLNSVNAVLEDISSMQNVEKDPLYTLIRMKRYEDDVMGMGNAINNVYSRLYLRDGIRWEQGEPVTKLIAFPI